MKDPKKLQADIACIFIDFFVEYIVPYDPKKKKHTIEVSRYAGKVMKLIKTYERVFTLHDANPKKAKREA